MSPYTSREREYLEYLSILRLASDACFRFRCTTPADMPFFPEFYVETRGPQARIVRIQ